MTPKSSVEPIKGFSDKVILAEKSSTKPDLGSYKYKLFLAWKGFNNDNLNTIFSVTGRRRFLDQYTSPETSPSAPALLSHSNLLFITWTSVNNSQLNVARVHFLHSESIVAGFSNRVTLNETSSMGPALGSHREKLFLAWKGLDNDNLNVIYSVSSGRNFIGKYTSIETSQFSPALVSHGDGLFVAWTGIGNNRLHVARVLFSQNGSDIEGFTNKIILKETSSGGPALGSCGGKLFLAWKGLDNDNLNVIYSLDGGRSFIGKYTSPETSDFSPALVAQDDNLFIAWTAKDSDQLTVAEVIP